MKLHRLLFYIYLFLVPIQTRILYNPDNAYINWYFDYHLAFFLYLSDIPLFACFSLWVIFDRPIWNNNRLLGLILTFLLLCLISLLHVKQIGLGIYEAVKWLEFFLVLYYISSTFRKNKDFDIAIIIIFLSSIFQAAIAWFQFHMQHMLGWTILGEYISPLGTPGLSTIVTDMSKVVRAYGTMPHPNILGAYLILGLISGSFLVSRHTIQDHVKNLLMRLSIGSGIALLLIGIFTTFSRISWAVAALAIIAFVGYYLINKKKTAVLIIVIAAAVSGTVVFALYSNVFKARVTDSSNVSVEDRYFFNRLGWELGSRNPILGVGVGNHIDSLRESYQLEPWQHQPPHNIFIFIFAELGILGLGIFILILLEVFRKIKNIFSDPISFTLILVGTLFLLMSMFDHYFVTIQQGRLMFATVLGLVAALPNIYDDQEVN